MRIRLGKLLPHLFPRPAQPNNDFNARSRRFLLAYRPRDPVRLNTKAEE